MKSAEVILIILLINTIVAVFYFLYMTLIKINRNKGILAGLLILFCPVVALTFLCLSWAFYRILGLFGDKLIDPADLSFRKNKVQIKVGADIIQNSNYVPLEEILLLTSKKNKRDGFLTVLKDDAEEYLGIIKQGVNDEDSEISHYAASSLMDIIGRFKEKEKELYNLIEIEPTSIHKAEYLNYVIPFLLEGILSITEIQKMMEKIELSMKKYTKSDFQVIKGEVIGKIALVWDRLGNRELANYWIKEALNIEPRGLEAYKAGLKYYYTTEEKDEFKNLLKNLKNTNIVIDNEVLELIRFFN